MASKISTRGNNVSVTHSFSPNRHTRKEKKKQKQNFRLFPFKPQMSSANVLLPDLFIN